MEQKRLKDIIQEMTDTQEGMNKELTASKASAADLQKKLEQAERDREAAIEAAKAAQKEEAEAYWVGQFAEAQNLVRMGQHDLSFAKGFEAALAKAGVSEDDPVRAGMEIPEYEDVPLDLEALEAKQKAMEQGRAEAEMNADGMVGTPQAE